MESPKNKFLNSNNTTFNKCLSGISSLDETSVVRRKNVPTSLKTEVTDLSDTAACSSQDDDTNSPDMDDKDYKTLPEFAGIPTDIRKAVPVFSMKEVAMHNTIGSSWIIYDGRVFNITEYIESGSHPGGNVLLMNYAGLDMTKAFKEIGHSTGALEEMQKYFIGYLEGHEPDELVEPPANKSRHFVMDGIDFNQPLVRQIYNTTKDQYIALTEKFFCSTAISDLFDNPILEFFSRTAWWVIPMLWLPVSTTLFARTYWTFNPRPIVAWSIFVLGILSWTLAEYCIHRFLFHFPEPKLPDYRIVRVIHFVGHGVHHLLPMDPMRLVMPPALLIILCTPFYLLSLIVLPTWFIGFLWAGILAGYICYDMIHYGSHYFPIDDVPYIHFMKRYHMKHHYKTPYKAFGVSSPLWDYIFRTEL